jgi:glycosyltransferase involved in cell wall biosynthesis
MGKDIISIPNPINMNLFCPHDKSAARKKCDLPGGKKIILFGSVKLSDTRKGISYFIESCKLLKKKYPDFCQNLVVAVVGGNAEPLLDLFPMPVYPLGLIRDEHHMVDVYNAVDLFVTPSLEDNLPNTIMESMACAVPCVGFDVGGIPEMIDHLHNGYVARYKDADDFANGIHWALDDANYSTLSEMCVHKVSANYSEGAVAMRYVELYNRVTGKSFV